MAQSHSQAFQPSTFWLLTVCNIGPVSNNKSPEKTTHATLVVPVETHGLCKIAVSSREFVCWWSTAWKASSQFNLFICSHLSYCIHTQRILSNECLHCSLGKAHPIFSIQSWVPTLERASCGYNAVHMWSFEKHRFWRFAVLMTRITPKITYAMDTDTADKPSFRLAMQ